MIKRSYILLLLIFLIIGVFALRKNSFAPDSSSKTIVNSVEASEFKRLSENKDAFLLDVHIPEQTHIPGTDAFIPYNEISKNSNQLPVDKNTLILVYCKSGSMSKEAAIQLQNLGYENVIDLAGGIDSYKEVNLGVEITPSSKDLGTVIYGEIANANFTLTNFTPEKLSITRVSTSCSCTTAELDKEVLEPYESTTVEVTFDPAVHQDDTDLGEITRTIYIDTDNPNFEQITTTITANVVKK